jgi:hypothetical protein
VTLQPVHAPTNLVPGAYRGVSVARVSARLDGPRCDDVLREHLLGREVYRRTRFIVVHGDAGGTAVVRVEKRSERPLFSPVVEVELLAGPDECAYVVAPDADTAVPSALARVAAEQAPARRAVVVRGRYEHVNFIVNPAPLRLVVQEVVPPEPAKLLDQVERLLAVAEDLPPILPVADTVSFADLAAQAPADRYLLPCRGSGVAVAGAETAYLDERPRRQPWTLLGCARSGEIHQWFYGDEPPTLTICPRHRGHDPDAVVLTKCCLLEDRIVVEDSRVVVPWGASLDQVRDALHQVARRWEPRWRPA